MTRVRAWLSERRRSGASVLVAVAAGSVEAALPGDSAAVDVGVIALLAYLLAYLVITIVAFARAAPAQIRDWAERDSRGTVLQRYLLGTAPGPGVSIFIAAVALAVAMIWLPGHGGGTFSPGVRTGVAVALVVVGWVCAVVSFAVAFHADDLVEDGKALDFPGERTPTWSDYVYFALSVMTTFGTTDVTVVSPEMRRTVTANAVIAFVFNTVTVAAVVSALSG